MKSVGEVMAIGRTFQESLQKALRGLEIGICGFDPVLDVEASNAKEVLLRELKDPGCDRIRYVADAFRAGMSVEDLYEHTAIDRWYLVQIEDIILEESRLQEASMEDLTRDVLYRLKRKGFSDERLASVMACQ